MQKILISLLLFLSQVLFSQTKQINTPKNALIWSNKYKAKAIWFTDMPQFNSDSSTYYFQKASKELQVNSKLFGFELAQIYYHQSDFLNINNSYTNLDSLARIGWSYFENSPKRLKNKEFEYNYLTNWSLIKLEIGETKTAVKLFSVAIKLADEFKSNDQKATTLADKGIFYERYKLEDEQNLALSYLTKSCSYYEKKGKAICSLELFRIYRAMIGYYSNKNINNIDSLTVYSSKMQSILKYIKSPQKHAWYYACTGRDLITYPLNDEKKIPFEQYNKGKKYIIEALDILEKYKINKNSIKPYVYGLLADIYMDEKKYDLAIANYNKSKAGYKLLKNRKGSEDITFYIAKAYEKKGDLKTALIYFQKFYNEAIVFEKKSNERSLRESELKMSVVNKEKELLQKSNQQIFFIVALGLSAFSLLLVYRNVRLKQKSNVKLATVNLDLENKNNLLDKRNAENELLMKEIHHRVKNNLEVVSSLLALQSAQIDDQSTKDTMAESQNRVNSIGIVHQKLYQGTNLGAVEMKDYFLNLSESILDSFGAEKSIDLKLAMENLDLDIDTAVPLGLIVNELLTNCIKYAFPKGEKGTITIKLEKQANNILRLEVADNGVGKSGITHGTGFGGQLISLLTQQLNGTMTEENQNGTTLIFDFKLKKAA